MESENFMFNSQDGTEIYGYSWSPDEGCDVKGIVQIAHGMAETAGRYERFAQQLTNKGYRVYAHDHRGHGKTAKTIENIGVLGEEEGFRWLVEDLSRLSERIKKQHPGLPLFLFGHSMGSFVAQRYIMLYGQGLKGVILSGSNGKQGIMLKLGAFLAKGEIRKYGRNAKSEKLNRLSFGSFNRQFKPNRTEFDWLSRDDHEVDRYIENPFCGTIFTAGFFYDFFCGLRELEDKKNLQLIPKELPIYIFSGAQDPVGRNGKGVKKLFEAYKNLGIQDVAYKLYPEGRHEMLNEINREEVMKDVIQWIEQHTHPGTQITIKGE